MKTIIALCSMLLPQVVYAQQTPQNPNTFGRWEIETESGMKGSVVIEYGYCHYSITSSFASIQSNCDSIWYEGRNVLMIVPRNDVQNRNARAFTVPEYQPSQSQTSSAQSSYSVGESTFAFQMTKFGRSFMAGHLMGAHGHDTATLRRH